MVTRGKTLAQISEGLIAYLRVELNDAAIEYATPLTRMQGGYETSTYRFELIGVQQELSKPLVLRLYPQFHDPSRAVWESTIQNALAGEGYPVPRVHLTCTDRSILGGAFLIMEFVQGELMLTAPFETIPDILGKAHASLHSLDPTPLIKSLRERGFDEHQYRLGRRLEWLHDQCQQ